MKIIANLTLSYWINLHLLIFTLLDFFDHSDASFVDSFMHIFEEDIFNEMTLFQW